MGISRLKRVFKNFVLGLPHIKEKRNIYIKNIRKYYNYNQKPPTILCSTCIGAMISHNLGLRFMSPTVNLWMTSSDFVKFVCDLDKYINAEIEFVKNSGCDYPVGKLDDITIYFQHYTNNEEALSKWNERKSRIDKDNIYIITDDNKLTDEETAMLLNAPCKRIIVFSNKHIGEKNFFRYDCFKNNEKIALYSVRSLGGFAPFEKEFNYAEWLSGGNKLKWNKNCINNDI